MNDYGTLDRLDNGDGRITFARHVPHEIDKVWAAVTEPDQLKVWFPTSIDGDRAAGAPLKFEFPVPRRARRWRERCASSSRPT